MNTIELAFKQFIERHKLSKEPSNLVDISKAFSALAKGIKEGDIEATLIGRHIHSTISNKNTRKLKVSAHNFEEFLVGLFSGRIIDKQERKKIKVKISSFPNKDINRRVERNKLEKLDVVLGRLNLSAKTLVPTNKELNIGSFSAEALFKGFMTSIPNERDSLGSKPLLEKQFQGIVDSGKWSEFKNRFVKMIQEVYTTDWIITIKNDQVFDVYTLSGDDFRQILISRINKGPKEIVSFINRFEAHALRSELSPIFDKAMHIKVELIGKSTPLVNLVYDKSIAIIQSAFESLMKQKDSKLAEAEIRKSCEEIIKAIKK